MVKKVTKKKTTTEKAIYFVVQEECYPSGPFDTVDRAKEAACDGFDMDYDDVYIVKAVLKAESPKTKVDWKPV